MAEIKLLPLSTNFIPDPKTGLTPINVQMGFMLLDSMTVGQFDFWGNELKYPLQDIDPNPRVDCLIYNEEHPEQFSIINSTIR